MQMLRPHPMQGNQTLEDKTQSKSSFPSSLSASGVQPAPDQWPHQLFLPFQVHCNLPERSSPELLTHQVWDRMRAAHS